MATTIVDFDLRALIREQLETTATADPYVIAEHVAKLVPDEHLRDALVECLPGMVREYIRSNRRDVRVRSTEPQAPPPPARKGEAISWHTRILNQQESITVDGHQVWKFFGDLTADEVEWAAGFREETARKNLAIAETYKKLAKEMRRLKAKTVRDLPAVKLEAIYR